MKAIKWMLFGIACMLLGISCLLASAFFGGGGLELLGVLCPVLGAVSYTHLDVYKRQSFDVAVSRMSEVLAITGRVLPVTTADVQLEAEFENGASVVGESKIFYLSLIHI